MECTTTIPPVPVRGWKRQNGLQLSSQLIHGLRVDIGRLSTLTVRDSSLNDGYIILSVISNIIIIITLCIMYLLFNNNKIYSTTN